MKPPEKARALSRTSPKKDRPGYSSNTATDTEAQEKELTQAQATKTADCKFSERGCRCLGFRIQFMVLVSVS